MATSWAWRVHLGFVRTDPVGDASAKEMSSTTLPPQQGRMVPSPPTSIHPTPPPGTSPEAGAGESAVPRTATSKPGSLSRRGWKIKLPWAYSNLCADCAHDLSIQEPISNFEHAYFRITWESAGITLLNSKRWKPETGISLPVVIPEISAAVSLLIPTCSTELYQVILEMDIPGYLITRILSLHIPKQIFYPDLNKDYGGISRGNKSQFGLSRDVSQDMAGCRFFRCLASWEVLRLYTFLNVIWHLEYCIQEILYNICYISCYIHVHKYYLC